MRYLTTFVLFILLVDISICYRSANGTESFFYLPEKHPEIQNHSEIVEVVELQKKADAHLENRDFFLNKCASVKTAGSKRFWLSMAVRESMNHLGSLQQAYTILKKQEEDLTEQYENLQERKNIRKFQQQFSGLEAMYNSLVKTSASHDAPGNKDALSTLRQQLDILKWNYSDISLASLRHKTSINHEEIINSINKRYTLLKALYAGITQGELI